MWHAGRVDLQINARTEAEAVVVAVVGEVDVATAPQLDAVLSDLIAGGAVTLVVDLSEVAFLDSTGLGVLVKAVKRTREAALAAEPLGEAALAAEPSGEAAGGVTVVTGSPRVLKVLAITGLDKAIPVHATVDAALGRG